MRKRGYIRRLWIFQAASDLAAVAASYITTYLIRLHSEWGESFFTLVNRTFGFREAGDIGEDLTFFYFSSAPRIIAIAGLTLIFIYALLGLYPGRRFLRPRADSWNIAAANAAALAAFFAYFYLRRNVFHPRSFFILLIFFNVFFTILFRSFCETFLAWLRRRFKCDTVPAVLFGTGRTTEMIKEFVGTFMPHGILIAAEVPFDNTVSFEEQVARLEKTMIEEKAGMLISTEPELQPECIMSLLALTDRLSTSAKILSRHLSVIPMRARQPTDFFKGVPMVHFESRPPGASYPATWRAASIVTGWIAFILALPFMVAIALLVRLTSRGPAIFSQERIGCEGKTFTMYKFRTMYDQADEMRELLDEFNEAGGALFKIRNDPRVTPVGRFLRRFSLDELPQLYNVARGEMVWVGPRPLPSRDFGKYEHQWQYGRLSGMPGLTCFWQISGRSDMDFTSMCLLDIYYLRNRNWIMDMSILLRTFWAVIFAKGAY